ncbi:MAG: ribosomal protein L7/L12 [Anaerolineaceae bacterium]
MSSSSWEYLVLEIGARAEEAERLLGERGSEGWELVAVVPIARAPEQMTVFLKRLSTADSPGDRVGNTQAGAPESAQGAGAEATEPPEPGFSVVLTGIRGEKDAVVLALAQLCPWLHLKDAKSIVESPPATVAVDLGEDEAAVLCLALIEIGAAVEVRGASAT